MLEVDDVQINENLSFVAKPTRTEDHQRKQLIGKTISMIKVLWDAKFGNSTYKMEETMRETYPYLFLGKSIFGDENFSCWEEYKDPEITLE